MTTLVAIVGWITLSAVCSPLIGQFLYLTSHGRLLPVHTPSVSPSRTPARRRDVRRRLSANSWSRKTYHERFSG